MNQLSPLCLSPAAFADSLLRASPDARILDAAARPVAMAELRDEVARLRVLLSHLPEGPVALCAAKTPLALAGLLAILSDGRAYAPLDPTHPEDRLTGILNLLRPAAVLVDEPSAARLADWAGADGLPLIALDAAARAPLRGPMSAGQGPEVTAVLHTSGSTGTPKQVRIAAPALVAFNRWVGQEFALTPRDCLLSHAPLALTSCSARSLL